MRAISQALGSERSPEELVERLRGQPGVVLLRTSSFESPHARFSFVCARPFLTFRAFGSTCEVRAGRRREVQFGNPWRLLESLIVRYEMPDEVDVPFPLGGCFGYWGYDLKNFLEPKLVRRAGVDVPLPDCAVGFYASVVVFDHQLGTVSVLATGLGADGSRSEERARAEVEWWGRKYESAKVREENSGPTEQGRGEVVSTLGRAEFIDRVLRAQAYIRQGDIYQVNLSQRLTVPWAGSGWELFRRLGEVSPAPFSAFLDFGEFQVASSSPELFLRMSGAEIETRPIKGTRPRSTDPARDAQLAYDLQTSPKEAAELLMITDLLRNDLGRVCDFGSVQVPELLRLERFPHVQHLVSTVRGRLRRDVTHLAALGSCFPGGSITGAPKFRAMQLIEELEPVARGPYTGALGYMGFNRETQLSIIIRAALCRDGAAHFHVGAGIVADSVPDAEYAETLAKAQGFFEALRLEQVIRGDGVRGRFPAGQRGHP